jgi:hypothetical protein
MGGNAGDIPNLLIDLLDIRACGSTISTISVVFWVMIELVVVFSSFQLWLSLVLCWYGS